VVTPLMLLAPIVASVFGVWLFHDVLGWKLIVGGIMTLTGILLVSIHPQIEKEKRVLAK
jgi:O-acetylserine/cysteine efflux transporter